MLADDEFGKITGDCKDNDPFKFKNLSLEGFKRIQEAY